MSTDDDTGGERTRTRFREPAARAARTERPADEQPAREQPTREQPAAVTTEKAVSTAKPAKQGTAGTSVPPPPAGRSGVGALTVVAVVVAVVMLAAAAVFAVLYVRSRSNASELADTRATVVSAAANLAVDFSSYDYRRLDTDFARVERQLTPAFRKSYSATAGALKATLVQYKAVGTARVLDSGLSRLSSSKATVIVFLDQTVTRSTSPTPSVDRNRIRVRLERSGDRWLVSALDVR